ncbi:hypothetical protein ABVT39_004937 [Epinephelus coioides]
MTDTEGYEKDGHMEPEASNVIRSGLKDILKEIQDIKSELKPEFTAFKEEINKQMTEELDGSKREINQKLTDTAKELANQDNGGSQKENYQNRKLEHRDKGYIAPSTGRVRN